MGKLDGKVAVITGGGRGIGREIAFKLGRDGARIVVNDLDAEPNDEVVSALGGEGIEAVACPGSVTAPDFADRLIGTATKSFGTIHIIVNNAGYTWDSVVQKTTDEQWYAMLDVHLTAPFRILRAAQPVIKAAHQADLQAGRHVVRKVVNTSSVAGLFGNVGQSGYSAGKAGIIGFTQTLAKEWGRLQTTVNCVAYGLIRTRLTDAEAGGGSSATIAGNDIKLGVNSAVMDQMERSIPLGRVGTPEDAAAAAYLFCIPESDYVSGQVLLCSGGMTGM